ncbi:MAG: ATP-binding protein [Peptostreptococcaceae bacterium]
MDFKIKTTSLNKKITYAFTFMMTLAIIIVTVVVDITFKTEFDRYIDKSNKIKVEQLNYELDHIYSNGKWNLENVKEIANDAITKGLAVEIYDKYDELIWSMYVDAQTSVSYNLDNIKENTQSVDQYWDAILEAHRYKVYDENGDYVGYKKITHYSSTYYMENDIEFLNKINNFMIVFSIFAIGSMVLISIFTSKSISKPIVEVSQIAKSISKGMFKNVNYKSDISEVNELIASINTLAEDLNEQELLRKRLTTDIAHELRTPITSVQGHLDAIIDGIWEPTPDRLKSINEEVSRLSKLIGELQLLAKYDTDKTKLNKSEVYLKDIIENVVYNLETKALEKNIKISCEIQNVWIYLDKNKISQVLINVLSNAIKYTNNDGYVYIKTYLEYNYACISIKDTGIGIPEKDLHYIFERFYRVDQSRNKETGGLGVGLTISRSILDEHNGDIVVNSEVGKGTEFIIKLPKEKYII